MKYPANNLAEIGRKIGLYFLKEKNNDYVETAKFLQTLNITNIEESSERITIYTSRPGLLIGRKGRNLEGLFDVLGKKIEIVEWFAWSDVMTPLDYEAEMLLLEEKQAYEDFNAFLQIIEEKHS